MKKIHLFISICFISGIAHAQPEWIVYNTSNSGLLRNTISDVAIDANGNKWIGSSANGCTAIAGLTKFDGDNWTTYNMDNSGLTCSSVISIVIDNNDSKWIGTNWEMCAAGLDKFDGINWTNYIYGCPVVLSGAVDASNNKWFATEYGLWKFDDVNWTVYNKSNSAIPYNYLRVIAIDNDNNKWIGAWGLIKFDGANWTLYDTSNSALPDNRIYAIAIDLNGDKWIGTKYGGLAKFDGTNWTVYDTSNSGLPDNLIYAIAIDLNGDKWIGTGYGGLAKFDGINWTVYDTSNSPLPHNWARAITIDGNGNKWIGTPGGLAVFNEDGVNLDPPKVDEDTLEPEAVIQIYSNPTNGQFVLIVGDEQPATIYIYDVFGKLIKQSSINNLKSTIDITQHAKGVYVVKVIQGEEIFVQKLVHQ